MVNSGAESRSTSGILLPCMRLIVFFLSLQLSVNNIYIPVFGHALKILAVIFSIHSISVCQLYIYFFINSCCFMWSVNCYALLRPLLWLVFAVDYARLFYFLPHIFLYVCNRIVYAGEGISLLCSLICFNFLVSIFLNTLKQCIYKV